MRIALMLCTLTLGACQTRGRYVWGNYSSSVYTATNGEGADVGGQIAQLTSSIEKARSTHLLVPPGMHAHLALLYGRMGNLDMALAALESEKELYPESAAFIDGVIARMGGTQ